MGDKHSTNARLWSTWYDILHHCHSPLIIGQCSNNKYKLAACRRKYWQINCLPMTVQFIMLSVHLCQAKLTTCCDDQRVVAKFSKSTVSMYKASEKSTLVFFKVTRICLYSVGQSLKKRAWRHGRAWKMKIRAWKNQDPCFNFYKHIYALLHPRLSWSWVTH